MRTTATKTRTKKRSPSRPRFGLIAVLFLAAALAPAQNKRNEPHAVLAGTVFRDPGFAQAGATVTLASKDRPGKKLQQQITTERGEFAFRVSPGPAAYIITATLKGFKPDRQEHQVQGEEQINATLLLVPESKK